MMFYDLPQNIPFHWRLMEGLSTGFITLAHLYCGTWTLKSLFVLLVHWFWSLRYHLTYDEIDKEKDQLLIQFMACERIGCCIPMVSLVPKALTIPLIFIDQWSMLTKTFFVTSVSSFLSIINNFYLCGDWRGMFFLFWGFISFLLFFVTDTTYFPSRLNKQVLHSPFICVLFHICLGFMAMYDSIPKCCPYSEPIYPPILDIFLYTLLFETYKRKYWKLKK